MGFDLLALSLNHFGDFEQFRLVGELPAAQMNEPGESVVFKVIGFVLGLSPSDLEKVENVHDDVSERVLLLRSVLVESVVVVLVDLFFGDLNVQHYSSCGYFQCFLQLFGHFVELFESGSSFILARKAPHVSTEGEVV